MSVPGARGGGGARAAGGGGGGKQGAQVDNSKADARTNNVRSSSTNNVNVEGGGWDRDYRPVAAAAVVGTAVAVGAAAASSNCSTVYSGGTAVQQCQY
jgi:hypothetical protein